MVASHLAVDCMRSTWHRPLTSLTWWAWILLWLPPTLLIFATAPWLGIDDIQLAVATLDILMVGCPWELVKPSHPTMNQGYLRERFPKRPILHIVDCVAKASWPCCLAQQFFCVAALTPKTWIYSIYNDWQRWKTNIESTERLCLVTFCWRLSFLRHFLSHFSDIGLSFIFGTSKLVMLNGNITINHCILRYPILLGGSSHLVGYCISCYIPGFVNGISRLHRLIHYIHL